MIMENHVTKYYSLWFVCCSFLVPRMSVTPGDSSGSDVGAQYRFSNGSA